MSHIPHASVPAVLDEFARVVRADGALFLDVAEGDGEGWEVASNYRSARRRRFTFHRTHTLAELLAHGASHMAPWHRHTSAEQARERRWCGRRAGQGVPVWRA